MNILRLAVSITLFSVMQSFAATAPGAGSISEVQDHMLSQVEREIVSLAKAMPADKYDFAPTQGAFKGVRTFGEQMSHIAAVVDEFAASILGEKSPDTGEHENGPASLHGKAAIVTYLENAFRHSHQAMQSLTAANYASDVTLEWGKTTRGALAIESVSHSLDHYGQAVVYARMNGVVPPASRKP